jgi:tetratricopeptide (TPR) repeat protein
VPAERLQWLNRHGLKTNNERAGIKMTSSHNEKVPGQPENQDQADEVQAAEQFRLGSEALNAKQYPAAYRYLHAALELERSPDHLSQYALALAHEKGEIQTSIRLCQEAIKAEPKNAEHFLRLGTIYLISGRRKEAIRTFHLGLRVGKHPAITKWLQILGHRAQPVLPFLSRTNPINKYLGKIRSSLAKK